MAEGLQTEDGKPLADVPPVDNPAPDQDWAAAMAAPEPGEPTAPAPPKKDPEAPYGRRADGTPKKGPGGRPPKAEKPSKAEKPRVQAAKKDYSQDLDGIAQLAWGVLAMGSPADAAALQLHAPGMVSAWNALAQESATVARGLDWLTSGGAYGAVVMATVPMVLQVLANHGRLDHGRLGAIGVQDPVALAEMTVGTVQAMQPEPAAA